MKKFVFLAFLFSTNLLAVENQLNICTRGEEFRAVEINYLTREKVPCEVNYTRNSVDRILWKAQYNEGYCEEKAAKFVNKLRDSGWSCRSILGEPKQ